MGAIQTVSFVTPLVTILASAPEFIDAARAPLEALLGPIALTSDTFPFNKTEYYAPSMGQTIVRGFFVFEQLADPAGLTDWKLAAHTIEENLRLVLAPSGTPTRPINVDPGYLAGSKIVLASTKDFAHRIYLRDGIFAEITMNYRKDAWESHYFTFPDFKSGIYDAFLRNARDRHLKWVKAARRETLADIAPEDRPTR
jgi:hypothetical protein